MRRIKSGALPFLRQFLPLKLIAEDVQTSLRILDHSFEYLSAGHATNQKWRSPIPSSISIVETNRRETYSLPRLLRESWIILSNISLPAMRRIKSGALPFLRQFLSLKLIAKDVQISLRILDHSFEYLSAGHTTNQKWRSPIPSSISIVETNRRGYSLSKLFRKSWSISSDRR